MTHLAAARGASPPLYRRAKEAFQRPADSAGILQGVRKLRQGKPNVRVVLVPSKKNQGTIACEGRLEAAMARSLELDPSIAGFRAQPFAMPGPKGRDVVCDFLVELVSGLYLIIDIKPSGRLQSPNVSNRMRSVRERLAQEHLPHRIVTELDLEREPARQIRDQLVKGIDARTPQPQCQQLLAVIRKGPITVAELRGIGQEMGLPPYAVEELAGLNLVKFEIDAPWSARTLIGDRNERNTSCLAAWGSVHDVVVRV